MLDRLAQQRQQTTNLIEKAKGALAGFVLNRAKFSVGSGYYYYYYGYKYSEKAYHK